VQFAEGNPYEAEKGDLKVMVRIMKKPITTLQQKRDEYSKDFQELLSKCLQQDPKDRSLCRRRCRRRRRWAMRAVGLSETPSPPRPHSVFQFHRWLVVLFRPTAKAMMDLKLFKKREGPEYVAKHLVAKVKPLIERFKAESEMKELLKEERERARSVRTGSDDSGWKSVGLAPFICPRCCSAMPTLAPAAAPPHRRTAALICMLLPFGL
jgi:hypothetical protein